MLWKFQVALGTRQDVLPPYHLRVHKVQNSTRMHSSRMRTARSLTVSHRKNHARPPEQPCTPPGSNHAHAPGATMHTPHPPRATMHAPREQPCMPPWATMHTPPEQPCTPPQSNHHAPPSNHTWPLWSNPCMPPLEQPCTCTPPPWTEWQTPVKT